MYLYNIYRFLFSSKNISYIFKFLIHSINYALLGYLSLILMLFVSIKYFKYFVSILLTSKYDKPDSLYMGKYTFEFSAFSLFFISYFFSISSISFFSLSSFSFFFFFSFFLSLLSFFSFFLFILHSF